ncbi:putative ligase forming aminoacyl-tRNA [Rosa chinensis]|uniref:Putative ligase forming aminoacyl-tRNA n=1 Tax=Rosa chinensis TaxID=74649 RepID=A0A2P6Q5A6_ROSCH|nr:putative ligase forming aminoacyl-tRNA [Rosa chinensis]
MLPKGLKKLDALVCSVGVMVMVHGDDRRLVMPPKVATLQAIVIPVISRNADAEAILEACRKTLDTLKKAGFRVKADLSRNPTPGQKYWHWEMKGVPLRIEIGQKSSAVCSSGQVRKSGHSSEQ